MESKSEIDHIIPQQFKPFTLFFLANTFIEDVIKSVRNYQLKYPLIIKPDIGMQSKAVVKVNNDNELSQIVSQFKVDYIIQPFIPYPKEMGIFYVRYPNEKHGRITGIVEKKFLTVTGDGISSIEQLLHQNQRYILQIPVLRNLLGDEIFVVLKKSEKKVLVPYGNHARGALFLDSSFKNNKQLEALIDSVCKSIDGFYYGRLDIRYNTFEELIENKNWCLIELNGAGSDPTHMYDPKHSLFFAWREIIRHWKMLYIISMQNKRKGYSFLPFKEGISMFIEFKKYLKKLNNIQFKKSNDKVIIQKTYLTIVD
ncbi:MAG: D-alanine--D-alanine ligase [Bacteroidota bacterium]|nr:D-alanine--D-alanine ligase [Bacteroidota bacterium]